MNLRKVIYDLGSNNGDDIPYYLMKSDLVVAVEANPKLGEVIRNRFPDQIAAGRLVLENCVVSIDGDPREVDFYLHKYEHVASQISKPSTQQMENFEKVVLPSKSIQSIIQAYGEPYYIKIDLEHFDGPILQCLFALGIFPPFISAEAHSIETFARLVAEGGYNSFKMVDGPSVSRIYSNRMIRSESLGSVVSYSFPPHSAGPFGNDIDGPWRSADDFARVLALETFGWKDIHATKQFAPTECDTRMRELFLKYLVRAAKSTLKKLFGGFE
jgi:FkbM family methyltransferase